jgi:hypothetical protein
MKRPTARNVLDYSVGIVVIFTCALVCYNIIATMNFAKAKDVTKATHAATQADSKSATAVSTANQADNTAATAVAAAHDAQATANETMAEVAKAMASSKTAKANSERLARQQDEIDKLYAWMEKIQKVCELK